MRSLLFLSSFAMLAAADTVVLRDGTILEGAAQARAGGVAVSGKTVKATEVLLWEDGAGLARNDPGLAHHVRGLTALAEREALALCLERLPKAVEAGDRETARQLLIRAEQAGIEIAQAQTWDRRIEGLSGTGSSEIAVPGSEPLLRLLVKRAETALDEEEQASRGYELLREALRRDEKFEAARDLLEEVAPTSWRVGEPGDDTPRIWLDWQIDVIEPGVRAVGRRQPDIQRAKTFWDRKLHGVQSQEIVFITPLTDSQVVGTCVKYARITCQALDAMFETPDPQRLPEDFLPLVIYMYESRQEYMEKAGASTGAPPDRLQFSLGFYVRGENVSRFFWPGGHDAEYQVRHTFVHELTHHWIERRNPRWHARDLAGQGERAQSPGFWIVEGMATFVEEGQYDIRSGRWTHFNPKANSLDTVAALSRDREKIEEFNKDKDEKDQVVGLLPWEKLFSLTQVQFNDGRSLRPNKPSGMIRKTWGVRPFQTSEMRLFYEQAAAACHYLYWAEKGKHRDRLLDYVTDFYTTQSDKIGIEVAFGIKPEELGAKVEEFARLVVESNPKDPP